MQMFLALITYLIWVKLNSRQTHGKHDSIGELNIFKNMYNKNFIHDTTRENFIQVAIWPISSHTHAHNTHSLKCSVRVNALSQRTKHNSQPLKIHYKKLLHNFCSLLSFFLLHFCPIFTLLPYSGEYFGRRHGGCSQNIYHGTFWRVLTLEWVTGFWTKQKKTRGANKKKKS